LNDNATKFCFLLYYRKVSGIYDVVQKESNPTVAQEILNVPIFVFTSLECNLVIWLWSIIDHITII